MFSPGLTFPPRVGGVQLGPTPLSKGVGVWSPARLGASLLGWWDAERADKITQSGGLVSSWVDIVAGYAANQASGGAKPVWSATSFNSRPGIYFDGVDDELTLASQPFPSGANAAEIWLLLDQQTLVADATARIAFAYGGGTSGTARRVGRGIIGGVNRAQAVIGGFGVNNTLVDFTGRHVLRIQVGATESITNIDGIGDVAVAVVPATGAVRVRIGATDGGTAFFLGIINTVAVTAPLTALQAEAFTTYLKARGGIS